MTYFEFNEKFPTDKSILQHFRTIRYKNGLTCPHCGSTQQVGLRTDQPKLCNCNHCHNTFYLYWNNFREIIYRFEKMVFRSSFGFKCKERNFCVAVTT